MCIKSTLFRANGTWTFGGGEGAKAGQEPALGVARRPPLVAVRIGLLDRRGDAERHAAGQRPRFPATPGRGEVPLLDARRGRRWRPEATGGLVGGARVREAFGPRVRERGGGGGGPCPVAGSAAPRTDAGATRAQVRRGGTETILVSPQDVELVLVFVLLRLRAVGARLPSGVVGARGRRVDLRPLIGGRTPTSTVRNGLGGRARVPLGTIRRVSVFVFRPKAARPRSGGPPAAARKCRGRKTLGVFPSMPQRLFFCAIHSSEPKLKQYYNIGTGLVLHQNYF